MRDWTEAATTRMDVSLKPRTQQKYVYGRQILQRELYQILITPAAVFIVTHYGTFQWFVVF